MKNIKLFTTGWKSTMKNINLTKLIYPLLFSVIIWFLVGLTVEVKSFFIIVIILILSYIFTCFLFVLKGIYKKVYYLILALSLILITLPFIPKLDIHHSTLIWYILSFLILHRVFYSIYNWALPINRRIKIQQRLFYIKQKIGILINNLKISPSHLLTLNFLALIILLVLEYRDVLNFSVSMDTIILVNITVYALILPLSLAIVTSNEYSKISKYYVELYQGWNLLFFLSYILLIPISMMYSSNYVSILSIFMIVNTFAFILNLTKQTSSEKIVERLFSKLENEINKGNYSFIRSTKSTLSWSNVKGFNINTGIIDKHKEFEYNINLLNQIAVKAIQNKDGDTFTKIIRGYLNISRFFLMVCKDDEKYKVSNLLSQIVTLSLKAKQDDGLLYLIINEMDCDYGVIDMIIDIQIWNLQRFKLMVSIAEKNKENKERFNHIISVSIHMLISKMMEGKFEPRIVQGRFSNASYIDFKNTEEFKELENIVNNNFHQIDENQIKDQLDMHIYENKMDQKFFDESKTKVLKELGLDKSKTSKK